MRSGGQDGFTLIELVLALAIIAIALVAVFAGLTLFFKSVVVQRSTADVDQVARSFTEQLQSASYVTCPSSWATSYKTGTPSVTLPTGYSFVPSDPVITMWNGMGAVLPGVTSTTTPSQFNGSCRTVNDGVTALNSNTVTSSSANFSASDIGCNVATSNLPANTIVTAIQSTTTVSVSNNATTAGSNVALKIGDCGAQKIVGAIRKDATGVTQSVTIVKRQAA